MNRETHEKIDLEDRLFQKAVQELGGITLGFACAYEAGKVSAAKAILENDKRRSYDVALDLISNAQKYENEL